ncbi:MAG: c-type cytochrome [Campylobacteraceae bacterium]|nr:c-type cytochrome [Campylobacteraceae bacterium]
MIKHVIAGVALILSVWASVHLYQLDKEVDKLQQIAQIIDKSKMEVVHLVDERKLKKELAQEKKTQDNKNAIDKNDKELAGKLQALKNKAGNVAAFKVSTLYKKNCSSCHGAIGEGIIGPKLIGRNKDYILKNLKEFKTGKRKNYVMYGLLGNLSDQQLIDLATEIGTFQEKLDKANK